MRGVAGLVLLLGLAACAGPSQQAKAHMDAAPTTGTSDLDALKGAMEASYDRERSLAERFKQLEESQAQLRADLDLLEAQLGTRSPDATAAARPADRPAATGGSGPEVSQIYAQAQADYNGRQYERAMRLFSRVIEVGPTTDLADNAQYWIGECYWGLGQYREALDAFAAVLRFPGTDKADDAQLKIGRCYAALGQRAKAEEALRTLLSDYPDSEYADAARRELAKLGKP